MSKINPQPITYYLLLFLILSNGACTTILTAKFEADTVGGPPNTTLPGAPTGDTLRAIGPMFTTLQVISESIEGSKALQFSNLNMRAIDGPQRWVTFVSKEVNLNRPITYSWSGKVVPSGNSLMFDLSLSSRTRPGSHTTILRLTLEDDGQLIASPFSYTTAFATKLPIGNVGLGVHSILVTLNTNTRKFGVTLYPTPVGGSRSPITISGDILVPIGDINTEANKPRFNLGFDGSGSSSDRKYLIDDLIVSRGND